MCLLCKSGHLEQTNDEHTYDHTPGPRNSFLFHVFFWWWKSILQMLCDRLVIIFILIPQRVRHVRRSIKLSLVICQLRSCFLTPGSDCHSSRVIGRHDISHTVNELQVVGQFWLNWHQCTRWRTILLQNPKHKTYYVAISRGEYARFQGSHVLQNFSFLFGICKFSLEWAGVTACLEKIAVASIIFFECLFYLTTGLYEMYFQKCLNKGTHHKIKNDNLICTICLAHLYTVLLCLFPL